MSPKPRTSRNLPSHILPDREKLPSGIWFNPSGKVGHWRIEYREGGKVKTDYLCKGDATLAKIHEAYEAWHQPEDKALTFRELSALYHKTRNWQKLRPDTKRSYGTAINHIMNTKTKNGVLGDELITLWNRGLVRSYRDKRAETQPASANIELAYIKSVFRWAHDYEHVKENIAFDLRPVELEKRRHIISDRDYAFFITVAKKQAPWYVWVMAELALACRARLNEVLTLTAANETPEGLRINRLKGSRDNIILWSPRLKEVWDTAIRHSTDYYNAAPIKKEHRYIIISQRTGDKIMPGTFGTVWRNAMKKSIQEAKAAKLDFEPFTFHDIKKYSISSDPSQNKQLGSGHRSSAMVDFYNLNLEKAESVI
jgi:site-specific recombinase XerD